MEGVREEDLEGGGGTHLPLDMPKIHAQLLQ